MNFPVRPMPAFAIRPARPEDAHVIARLIHELADYENLSESCRATPDRVRDELFGEKAIIHCVLAWERDAEGAEVPVGFALYFFNFSTFLTRRGLYLEDLYIVPESRRRGCGGQLIRHLAREALRAGCGRFEWTVLDWNEPAIDFYKKLGARILEDWRICRVEGEELARLAGGPDHPAPSREEINAFA